MPPTIGPTIRASSSLDEDLRLQVLPSQPSGHEHLYGTSLSQSCMQTPSFRHLGSFLQGSATWHLCPQKPLAVPEQRQVKDPRVSLQRLPCSHGFARHSSMLSEQVWPENPVPSHSHRNPLTISTQLPPCKQGFDAHSSISSSHFSPVNPGWQRHSKLKAEKSETQVPPFSHSTVSLTQ